MFENAGVDKRRVLFSGQKIVDLPTMIKQTNSTPVCCRLRLVKSPLFDEKAKVGLAKN
jgi:hypothetical protein